MANQEQNPPQQEQPFVAAKKSPNMYKEYLADFGTQLMLLKTLRFPSQSPLVLGTGFQLLDMGKNLRQRKFQEEPSSSYVEMKDEYGDGDVTLYPTQVFSVKNWALKPNQPEEPPFTDYMLVICSIDKLVVFKAPKLSSNAKRDSQGIKPRAQPGHKKHSTSLKQSYMSSKEATKGVTSEARSNPQLSSGMSTFNLKERIYLASFIIHFESASGNDALTVSTAEADLRKSAPSHFTKPKYVSEGLEIVLTQPRIGKGASFITRQVEEEEPSGIIKLEDPAKLVSNVQPSFKDLDSPEDNLVIFVDECDKDEEDEVHTTINAKTEDTSVPKSLSTRFSQIQELTDQVLILQSQKHKLELEKNKAEAEAALLKAQPSFPNVGQLNELLVKSLQTEFSKILSAHDFSSLLPTKLKDLPSKFNELTKEVRGLMKQVHELEIPTKLEDFTKSVTSLLLNVTKALNKFAQGLDSTSSKGGDQSVPLAGQADIMPVEGEKNTNQATISQLF
ncbi:hypothetical protein Tco_0236728 [Tanacetum coccineum]